MKKHCKNSKDDIFYSFSVEVNDNKGVLEEYLLNYPEYRNELIELSIELSVMPMIEDFDEVDVNESITSSWEHFQVNLTSSDSLSLGSNIVNPLENLDRADFRSLAQKLNVNIVFLAMVRDRTIEVSTFPVRFVEMLSSAIGVSSIMVKKLFEGPALVSSAQRFKADKAPVAKEQVTFDDAIENSHLTDVQKETLIDLKD